MRGRDDQGGIQTIYKLLVDENERRQFHEFTLIQQFDASLATHVLRLIVNKNEVYVGKTQASVLLKAQLKAGVVETYIEDYYMYNL